MRTSSEQLASKAGPGTGNRPVWWVVWRDGSVRGSRQPLAGIARARACLRRAYQERLADGV